MPITTAVPPWRIISYAAGGLFAADGLEPVGALVRERLLRRILDRGVDDMGGTEVASSGEFLTADIDGNDRSRTGDRRTVDCGQADAAPDDDD